MSKGVTTTVHEISRKKESLSPPLRFVIRSFLDKVYETLDRELSLQEEPGHGRKAKPDSLGDYLGLSFVMESLH